MTRYALMGILAMVCSAGSVAADTIMGFQGPYDPANWTFASPVGSVDTAGAPDSITLLIPGDLFPFADTDFTIVIPDGASGTVMFDWAFATGDNAIFQNAGFLLNGAYIQLTNNGGASNQSGGPEMVAVTAGDTFGFRLRNEQAGFGPASLTITNFKAPIADTTPIPEPSSLLVFGFMTVVMFVAGYKLRRKRATTP